MIERGEFGDRLLQFEPVDDFFAASTALATFRCRHTFTATTPQPTASATRRSIRRIAVLLRRRRPVCISLRRCSMRSRAGRRDRARYAARWPGHVCAAARGACGRSAPSPGALHAERGYGGRDQSCGRGGPPHRGGRHYGCPHAGTLRARSRGRAARAALRGDGDLYLSGLQIPTGAGDFSRISICRNRAC